MKTALSLFGLVVLFLNSHELREQCGVGRWDVKVLNDADTCSINWLPVNSIVAELAQLPQETIGISGPRLTSEKTVCQIAGDITFFKKESDKDIHLVFVGKDSSIVVEIPSPDCPEVQGASRAAVFAEETATEAVHFHTQRVATVSIIPNPVQGIEIIVRITPSSGQLPLLVNQFASFDTCQYLRLWEYTQPQNVEGYAEQYDTLKLYVEKCAASDKNSWDVFTTMDGAVSFMSTDTTRYDAYRAWLVSVLFLNTTEPRYFCQCLASIADTYNYGKYKAIGTLAVLNYLRQYHPECWSPLADDTYSRDSAYDAQHGYDVLHLPPLDSMGLEVLLGHANTPIKNMGFTEHCLSSFISNPNPFVQETVLRFTLTLMTYTTITICDELGRLVWGDDRGSSLEAGTHTITLDGKNLPHGTLYARISTGFGEVKTVKLIHE